MKYPAEVERERRMAEIVRQLREARAQLPPSYPTNLKVMQVANKSDREWRKAA